MSLTLKGAGQYGAWTPASLPGFVISLLPSLSRSQGKLWQDSGKTVAATADGHPVRVATCPYSGLDWTASSDAARPLLWDEGGDKWSLSFDGVDDIVNAGAGPAAAVNPTCSLAARAVAGNYDDHFMLINGLDMLLTFGNSGLYYTGEVWRGTAVPAVTPRSRLWERSSAGTVMTVWDTDPATALYTGVSVIVSGSLLRTGAAGGKRVSGIVASSALATASERTDLFSYLGAL